MTGRAMTVAIVFMALVAVGHRRMGGISASVKTDAPLPWLSYDGFCTGRNIIRQVRLHGKMSRTRYNAVAKSVQVRTRRVDDAPLRGALPPSGPKRVAGSMVVERRAQGREVGKGGANGRGTPAAP